MTSRRRELARTDETTLSEGLRRNLDLEDVASFAEATGMSIEGILSNAKTKDELAITSFNRHFAKPIEFGKNATPREILEKTLSVRSVLSTSSSFAERMEALRGADPKNMVLTEIGRGSFGTVYEIPGTSWCLKKTLTDPTVLFQEFLSGRHISFNVNVLGASAVMSIDKLSDVVMPRVPRYLCSYGMESTDSPKRWFAENGHMFPEEKGGRKPGPVNVLERILPLRKIIRENLIKVFFRPEKQAAALADPTNKACICRAYLGCSSEDVEPSKLAEQRATLQNFPLYLNDLEDLNMHPSAIARDMAMGLAAGHWRARVNMLDVEYVIGSRSFEPELDMCPLSEEDKKAAFGRSKKRTRNMVPDRRQEGPRYGFRNRAIQLWMIDFNKVKDIDCSITTKEAYDKNIRDLVYQTRSTDGEYYPRAIARTEWEWELWLEFAKTYVIASKAILQDILDTSVKSGFGIVDNNDLVMARPALVMEQWLRLEAEQKGMTTRQFIDRVRGKGWRWPGKN